MDEENSSDIFEDLKRYYNATGFFQKSEQDITDGNRNNGSAHVKWKYKIKKHKIQIKLKIKQDD